MGLLTTIIGIIKPTPVKPVPILVLPMKVMACKEHEANIVVFKYGEETLFKDDNSPQVVIFTDKNGKRYLKRYVIDGCNENCEEVKKVLNGR